MDANQLRLYHGDGTPTDKREYLKAIGSLLYRATGTRPDLAYAVGLLSRYVAEPNHYHNAGVKRVLPYLKGTMDTRLNLGGDPTRGVIGYSDASHAEIGSLHYWLRVHIGRWGDHLVFQETDARDSIDDGSRIPGGDRGCEGGVMDQRRNGGNGH